MMTVQQIATGLMWRLHRIEIDGQMRLNPHDESYWCIAPLVYARDSKG